MFKNGKIFGKVNLLDGTVLVLVIALLIAGALKFRTFNKTVDSNSNGKVVYTFIINNVREYTLSAFKSGDNVFDGMTDVNIGHIIKVDAKDANIINALADGTTILSDNPYKKDIILTIEAPGSSTSTAYFANKSIELKIGSEKNIKTLYAETAGKIASIEYIEGE